MDVVSHIFVSYASERLQKREIESDEIDCFGDARFNRFMRTSWFPEGVDFTRRMVAV